MYSHMMVGSNDIDRSKKFYDALFKSVGGPEAMVDPKGRLMYIHKGSIFMVTPPIDGKEATNWGAVTETNVDESKPFVSVDLAKGTHKIRRVQVSALLTPAPASDDTIPLATDEDPASGPEVYGAMKVGCEAAVVGGAASSTIIRPGLIAGPGDPSGRFTYWPLRLAEGGDTLAGGAPTDVVQVIDVRDLAAWIVTCAERRTTGVLDGVGPAVPVGDLLAEVAHGIGSDATLTWVPDDVLADAGVEPWAGAHGLPLWLPRPAYDGMLSHDVEPSYAAGLVTRPVAETARDTLGWAREHPDGPRTGLSREHERRVLAAWATTRK